MPPAVARSNSNNSRTSFASCPGISSSNSSEVSLDKSASTSAAASGAISSSMSAAFSGSRSSTICVVSRASNSPKTAAAVCSSREAMMLWRSEAESSSMMSARSAGCRSSSFSWVMRSFTRRRGSGSIRLTNSQRMERWGNWLCSLRTTLEGTTPCSSRRIAPAISNAIFDATGVRLRTLPFRPATVKAGLAM